jgi:hypothetical protein
VVVAGQVVRAVAQGLVLARVQVAPAARELPGRVSGLAPVQVAPALQLG